jgi:RNA ligase
MITPEAYFKEHNLYDVQNLNTFCEIHSVYQITSLKFPNLVMLHYMDECQYDNKWSTFSRMARGLIVDMKNQKIIAYPFDKFFNLGQMPETNYDILTTLGEFEVSEKLDGSMLILFSNPETGSFHFTTKGSFDSEHGAYAMKFLSEQLKDNKWVNDYTLIFELISPKFQIVVNYKVKGYEEGIYLIGARHRYSNTVLSYNDLQKLAQELKVPTVKTYEFKTLDEVITKTETLPVLEEGYVLHFLSTGLRVKVKGTNYLRAHRFISKLSDKYLLEYLGLGKEAEVLQIAPEEYKAEVEARINFYKQKKQDVMNYIYSKFAKLPKDTRKEFALSIQLSSTIDSRYAPFLFQIFDGKSPDLKSIYRLVGNIECATATTRI